MANEPERLPQSRMSKESPAAGLKPLINETCYVPSSNTLPLT